MQFIVKKGMKKQEIIDAILVLSKLLEHGSMTSEDVKKEANKKILILIELL